jgi:hypothetical protein
MKLHCVAFVDTKGSLVLLIKIRILNTLIQGFTGFWVTDLKALSYGFLQE